MSNDPRPEAVGRQILRNQGFEPRDDRPIGGSWLNVADGLLEAADAADRAAGVYRIKLDDAATQLIAGVMRESYGKEPEWSLQVVARAVVAALRSGAVQ